MRLSAPSKHALSESQFTLHYIIKLFIVAKVKKTARSTMAQVTQRCQDMTPEISVSSYTLQVCLQFVLLQHQLNRQGLRNHAAIFKRPLRYRVDNVMTGRSTLATSSVTWTFYDSYCCNVRRKARVTIHPGQVTRSGQPGPG